jgi:DHA1 family bicyclomycin/chloramphenicol resistance-like MFS transporter
MLWLITGCLMLQPLSTDFYLASLPHLVTWFGSSPAVVQQTLSLFALTFGVAQLAIGPLSDRYGRRPVLLAGVACYVVASLACAFAESIGQLIAGRVVQAVGCCSTVVVGRAIVRDAYTLREGARVIARASTLMSLAPLFGPIAGAYLQVAFGWQAAFVFFALFGLVLGMALARNLHETNVDRDPESLRAGQIARRYGEVLRAPVFWSYALPGALSYASIFVYISGVSFALIGVLGLPTQHFGYAYALGVSGYLLGTIVCRRLLASRELEGTMRIGARLALVAGFVYPGVVLSGVAHPATVVPCLFLTMFAHGINFPCAQTGAVAPFPRQAGAAAGLLGALAMFAALVTATWIGASFHGTLLPMSLTSAVIGVLLFASSRGLARFHGGQ